jgi:hypothetical protein
LGGSSAGLPDIVAVNKEATLLSIEAKSGKDVLYDHSDQLLGCLLIIDMLGHYRMELALSAFEFMRKKVHSKKVDVAEKRKFDRVLQGC